MRGRGIVAALVALAVTAAAPASADAVADLAAPEHVRLLRQPERSTTGDLNGDGRVDIAVAHGGPGQIAVLSGRGGGRFRAPRYHDVFGTSYDLAIADLNGDGRQDLAVAAAHGTASVLLASGDGYSRTDYKVGTVAAAVVAADVNGDARIDLAFADEGGGGGVAVLLGQGDGTFGAPIASPAHDEPVDLAAADFDRDGRLDLAVANFRSSDVSILRGRGDGTFEKLADHAVPSATALEGVVASDLDGDGASDLAVANGVGGLAFTFRGRGDGGFEPRAGHGPDPDEHFFGDIAAGDLDRDGRPDVVITGERRILVLRNLGGGRLGEETWHRIGHGALFADVADLNADRRPDVVVTTWPKSGVAILMNRGPAGRARVRVASARADVVARELRAPVRLACGRGVGRCEGVLALTRPGEERPLGRASFSIPPRESRLVRVPARFEGRSLRVRATATTDVATARGTLTLVNPTRAERRASCLPRRGEVLAASRTARVFAVTADGVFGCLYSLGRWFDLGRPDYSPEPLGPFAVAGRFAAYHARTCGEGVSGCIHEIEVMDLSDGSFRHDHLNSPPQPDCNIGFGNDCGYPAVGSVVVKPNASVAWIACDGVNDECDRSAGADASIVMRADSRGSVPISESRSIDPESLRLTDGGRRIAWREGGSTRSADLR